jgi:TRAP-type transport system small permease protein
MDAIERAIVLVCKVLLWVSTTLIFIILVANTFLRYATGSSLQWANEVPELLFPWLVMSGVVLAASHSAHITTSFMRDALPARHRKNLGVMVSVVVAALYCILAVATFRMLSIVHDEKSPILQVPGSFTYACVMVGMIMLAILALKAAWREWQAPLLSDGAAVQKTTEVHW